MAIVRTSILAGDDIGNAVDQEFILDLVWGPAPVLAPDGLSFSYAKPEGDLVFESDAGFGALWAGTINGIRGAGIDITGLQLDAALMLAALRDADADAINALLWARADTMTGSAGIDELHGFGGNDLLRGGGGNDSLHGGGGLDRLYGDAGDDFLTGGAGRDTLFGTAGNDTLMGGSGDDRLIGGAGIDRMLGGTGADEFVFTSAADIAPGGPGSGFDVVADLRADENDFINLAGVDANTLLDGDQAFASIGSAEFAANAPGTLRIAPGLFPNSFLVQLNTDDDAQFEHMFVVSAPGGLDASMFAL